MRIAIPITGTRGDLQPYLALGKGLLAAGHDIRIATHDDFAEAVRREGLKFSSMGGNTKTVHAEPAVRKMMNEGGNPFAYLTGFARVRAPIMSDLVADCLVACRDVELILVTPSAPLIAMSVAEKLRIRVCGATFLPSCPSRHLANCYLPELPPWIPGRSIYNVVSYNIFAAYLWQLLRKAIDRARREVLDLPAFGLLGPPVRLLRDIPTLHGYSPRIVTRPTDWPDNQFITGYWFLNDEDWQPPPELDSFLKDGPPPVYIGFGSMQNQNPEALTRLVTLALKRTGLRAVLARGWGALGEVANSDQLFFADSIPHDWLFSRVAAVVHHGGAGTTAAGLRAGIPSLLVPFFGDQFFWGRRVLEHGVGARAIPRQALTSGRLADALETIVHDGAIRERAAELGKEIRAEDGVCRAVNIAERIFAGWEGNGSLRTFADSR